MTSTKDKSGGRLYLESHEIGSAALHCYNVPKGPR